MLHIQVFIPSGLVITKDTTEMIHRMGHLQGNSPLSLDRPPSRNFHWFNYPAFHILSHGRFLIFVLFLRLHYIGKLSKSLVLVICLIFSPFPSLENLHLSSLILPWSFQGPDPVLKLPMSLQPPVNSLAY